jgi:hypothetical protein
MALSQIRTGAWIDGSVLWFTNMAVEDEMTGQSIRQLRQYRQFVICHYQNIVHKDRKLLSNRVARFHVMKLAIESVRLIPHILTEECQHF